MGKVVKTESYLEMMKDSLDKKIELLKQIQEKNKEQYNILSVQLKDNEVDQEAFDKIVEEKSEIADELDVLNDGFTSLFDNLKNEINDNKERYKDQIIHMQGQIRDIMDLTNTIELQEHANKELADTFFSNERKKLKGVRNSSRASMNYYQNMNRSKVEESMFMDEKQ
ncbi:hypothetical protein [Butyrivibrio sp. NC3005]|uniref:hypothetical protein n=1 Tax=Butyrivibrio sp. NC3005 TaxID=1280685 RepID=UPI0003FBD592|nr:hypothetical protein [Butyrivibrio sp. NC3005]